MLDGIETGYEGRFDFPERDGPPDRVYVLASLPRSGSTYLSHVLWESGCLGAPLEYLNFLPGGHYGFAANSPDRQIELWRHVLKTRTSPNGVFGAKCFPMLIYLLARNNPPLYEEATRLLMPADRSARVVRLRRRDRLSHAISYARATRSGIWREEQEAAGAATVPYSKEAVDQAMDELERAEAGWEPLFASLTTEPLTLWHEDVVERPEEAVRRVADFLEVEVDPAASVAVPKVKKQSDTDSRAWAQRYRSEVAPSPDEGPLR
jgi:LPS sulfotransferase NodH